LNALAVSEATAALQRCCRSTRWAREMAARRPFATADEMFRAADDIWWSLGPDDWREAFAAHPRIGEATADRQAAREQAHAAGANQGVRDRLARANRAYEERFGYIFIVCAAGKSASEMLAILESRLPNAPDEELRIAAEEQRRITRLRLETLLT
jgi:2-oxo-4-hydroxy-4-carboxy-5-ureidoimidazoline decarboxylase